MATIGLYDSGIGGLTTLRILLQQFKGNTFYYLADNLNHPFGTRSQRELCEIINTGIARLKAHSDIQVLACNTSSQYYAPSDVFKLLPPVYRLSERCLLMATDATLESIPQKIKYAQTSELATLIEVHVAHALRHDSIIPSTLLPYLKKRIGKFRGVDSVILGCSHYPYVCEQLRKILGDITFFDGNNRLVAELSECVSPLESESKITFAFTGENEEKKYAKILELLCKQNAIKP